MFGTATCRRFRSGFPSIPIECEKFSLAVDHRYRLDVRAPAVRRCGFLRIHTPNTWILTPLLEPTQLSIFPERGYARYRETARRVVGTFVWFTCLRVLVRSGVGCDEMYN